MAGNRFTGLGDVGQVRLTMLRQRRREALREVDLKRISRGDVLDGALDGGDVGVAREVGAERLLAARRLMRLPPS